ncbi:hypothetical protein B0H12DRAFT_1076525 [Mycena haematopus]|nr:hypothetical protein B0H12DRAFT_1076525 [Mycena haematopus]
MNAERERLEGGDSRKRDGGGKKERHDVVTTSFVRNHVVISDQQSSRNCIAQEGKAWESYGELPGAIRPPPKATGPTGVQDFCHIYIGGRGPLWAVKKKFHDNFWNLSLDHVLQHRRLIGVFLDGFMLHPDTGTYSGWYQPPNPPAGHPLGPLQTWARSSTEAGRRDWPPYAWETPSENGNFLFWRGGGVPDFAEKKNSRGSADLADRHPLGNNTRGCVHKNANSD